MISRASIDEVKNRIDIVDVISDFISLKRSGQNYKALSPFSNEKTPSFYVVPAKGIFKDFSSGKGGDAHGEEPMSRRHRCTTPREASLPTRVATRRRWHSWGFAS